MTRHLDRRAAAALDHEPYVSGLTAPSHVLDALAQDALAVALDQAHADTLLADPGRRAALGGLLLDDPLAGRPFQRRASMIANRFVITRPEGFGTAGARLLARRVAPRASLGDLLAQALTLLRRGRRTSGRFGAVPLATALAASRWSAAAFRLEAAASLRRVLRHKVLFHPGPAPAPVLSPALWWPLISGLLPPTTARRRDRLHPAIAQQAARALAQERWLGFWELYLLRSLDTEARANLPSGLRDLLDRDASSLRAIAAAEIAENPLLRLDWPDTVPSYAEALLTSNH